jgi:GNAT-family acetyltransferase (TIGR03103 family)
MRHYKQRFDKRNAPSLQVIPDKGRNKAFISKKKNAVIQCGWGRLIFGQTFSNPETISAEILKEQDNHRDIALYLRDPHVVLSLKPQELFLDPSHTYRLWFSNYLPGRDHPRGFQVRRIQKRTDAYAINRILRLCDMLPANAEFIWEHRDSSILTYVIAEDPQTGQILGTVTGVDHVNAFSDPENGSSLWCLAVDPQAAFPGIGHSLVAYLADYYSARERSYLDLSVMHDNTEAIALYESMNFRRMPIFCVKRKNPINEQLFTGPDRATRLNPYCEIIIDEAKRRGIGVEILDADQGYFELIFGGRSIVCRESLSELTTAIAMSRCANKQLTVKVLGDAGINVPEQMVASDPEESYSFLKKHRTLVVKPVDSEQGRGITPNVKTRRDLKRAIKEAEKFSATVLLEEFIRGEDVRAVMIDYKLVAAAVRKPATVIGNGRDTILCLIRKQSRRRESLTSGESRIPVDEQTESCVRKHGFKMDDILPEGKSLRVRETANLHTGGTIHDITDNLHHELIEVCKRAARLLDLPVTGLDLIVPDITGREYVIIEANERPGLANHEPQPTAEKFIDLLFPQTRRI